MNRNNIFVSPGVYTSEKDLTFVTRQIGVTTLGSVGETLKGPAFQPIFVSNYNEFKTFFGGTSPVKFKGDNKLKYELPYIAKEFLAEANQMFVTRVLGLSGYNAGKSWGLVIDGGLDTDTIVSTDTNVPYTISFTGNTTNGMTNLISNDVTIQAIFDNDNFGTKLNNILSSSTGDTFNITQTFTKENDVFIGASFTGETLTIDETNGVVTGTLSGLTNSFSGDTFADSDNKLIALLRSRGTYNGSEELIYEIDNNNDITITNVSNGAYGDITLSGTSVTQGNFELSISFNPTTKNYITKVIGRTAKDNTSPVFIEELFQNTLNTLINSDKVWGIKPTLIEYGNSFLEYNQRYKNAITPFVVSELRGDKVYKLFRFHTISDGNTANKLIKISITNIRPDDREFDVLIRDYNDTDENPVILERFSRCTMNPSSSNYIARRIGTIDGDYQANSDYILIELDNDNDSTDAFPAGFIGYPLRDYQFGNNTDVLNPDIRYKTEYTPFERKRRVYLGISNTVGIDDDVFGYKGLDNTQAEWNELTKGFHMDVDATTALINNVSYEFEVGNTEFRNDLGLNNTDYQQIDSRKFTFVPYGGFDGWDVYRDSRTSTDTYAINGTRGALGLQNGVFTPLPLSNGENGISSDFYAYLEAIRTFSNPKETNINVLTTSGVDTVDNLILVEDTIEMVERERADCIYIVNTPDTNTFTGEILEVDEISDLLDRQFDSSYTATYYPWIQINDTETNRLVYISPTSSVVRSIALTDKISSPWFAPAGLTRGLVNNAIKTRKKLKQGELDKLYTARVNPIDTQNSTVAIWGNKTMQIRESALQSLNVRRLLLQARQLISAVSVRLLFEPNDSSVREEFLSLVNPILEGIRNERGLIEFRVEVDDSQEALDTRTLNGRIFIRPTRSLEVINIEFVLTDSGASFDDV